MVAHQLRRLALAQGCLQAAPPPPALPPEHDAPPPARQDEPKPN